MALLPALEECRPTWPHAQIDEVVELMRPLFVEYCGGVEVI
jgi:hypothetical protein